MHEGFPSMRIEVYHNCNGFLLADKLCSVKKIIKDQAYAAKSFSFLKEGFPAVRIEV